MSSNIIEDEKNNVEVPLWEYLCNKLDKTNNTSLQIRKYAKEYSIEIQGKNKKELCQELSKNFKEKDKNKNIVNLAKLIDNYEGGFRNYFEPQDINNWNEGKGSYEYHQVLYNVKNLDIIKENKNKLAKLFQYKQFPTFGDLLNLLIFSIENIPVEDRQTYVMSLKEIFMNDQDLDVQGEEEEKLFEYDYENEYGIRR